MTRPMTLAICAVALATTATFAHARTGITAADIERAQVQLSPETVQKREALQAERKARRLERREERLKQKRQRELQRQ